MTPSQAAQEKPTSLPSCGCSHAAYFHHPVDGDRDYCEKCSCRAYLPAQEKPTSPRTEAGRSLLRQWAGHPNESEVAIVVTAIEAQAREAAAATPSLPLDDPIVRSLNYPCREPIHQQAKQTLDALLARLDEGSATPDPEA